MNRRTLLAGIGGASIAGTAGCYGLAQLITGDETDENSNENTNDTDGGENATESPLADDGNGEGNNTSETTTDEESNGSAENESESEGNESDGPDRPADAVDTISVTDHGLDISESPDPDVDREITCCGTFQVGEYDLRKVRIDAVALAENGDRMDHGWVPFFQMGAGESYDIEIPFYVNPDEIAEYLIGATEAQYVE